MNDYKARAVGINHVSISVGDIKAAVEFYGKLLSIKIGPLCAEEGSIEMGDQFLAFTKSGETDRKLGHFGFVVDDREKVREALKTVGIEPLPGRFLGFIDPWGNHIEVVSYENIKFSKTDNVLKGMGLGDLEKNENAKKSLVADGLAGDVEA
ncbi:VOC family protein [Rheinheimera sp. WS51]|uniref:VOC family protein n=1 Tax=Rheinheimera sp. WS51 TaxID=3425886 RepID=UPI003D9104F6